jgi:Response regulator of the LytR/AlgR family
LISDFGNAVVDEASSIAISLILLPFLLAACERWPLQLDNWRRRLPLYILGSMLWTLCHVAGMVLLRKLIHAAVGGHYDYGDWPENLLYEYGKDVQTFFLIVTVALSFAWYARIWRGEAHQLSWPDEGVPVVPEAEPDKPQRFLVRKLGREFLIATNDIEWLQANGNYVNLNLAGKAYPLRSTIGGIEAQLDARDFQRVHRSHIVNLRFIDSIESTEAGDARIHLKDGRGGAL